MKILKRNRVLLLFAMAFCFLTFGCRSSNAPPPNPVMQAPSGQEQGAPPLPQAGTPKAQYLDFPDIPIPAEINLVPKDSYVFQAGAMKTGILTLRGRVDINSLITYFGMSMPYQGWKPKGQFRYKRSALIFEKPDKTCVIILYEDTIYTYVEIYVAPMAS